jgi:hypothetical protein
MGSGNTKQFLQVHRKILPHDEAKYEAKYWDQRYLTEEGYQFDWLARYGLPSENLELRKVLVVS